MAPITRALLKAILRDPPEGWLVVEEQIPCRFCRAIVTVHLAWIGKVGPAKVVDDMVCVHVKGREDYYARLAEEQYNTRLRDAAR